MGLVGHDGSSELLLLPGGSETDVHDHEAGERDRQQRNGAVGACANGRTERHGDASDGGRSNDGDALRDISQGEGAWARDIRSGNRNRGRPHSQVEKDGSDGYLKHETRQGAGIGAVAGVAAGAGAGAGAGTAGANGQWESYLARSAYSAKTTASRSHRLLTSSVFIMIALSAFSLFAALRIFSLIVTSSPPVGAAPVAQGASGPGSSTYWVADIKRQGTVAFGGDSNYKVFRNVKDFGAAGDGTTDDTAAIQNAITSGNRCGKGCDSSTVTPALVYFPPGTYLVSQPIIQYYYTQFVGDALSIPTIKASAGFQGIAVIDSDPYEGDGSNWYTNQNNFFRQIRNFVIDLTAMPMSAGAGIHWQVAQATSLQNIVFNMHQGGGDGNKQLGIFMDNGSGGFMSDLTFNGGNYGAFFGNQQFTTRNLIFNGCNTAIFMNWNWGWTLKSVSINNCGVGLDMANSPSNQTVGSVLMLDSKLVNTPIGVKTAFTPDSIPTTGGTLILDNVDFSGSTTAVQSADGATILAGGSVVKSWGQGREYQGANGHRIQGDLTAPNKPASLLDSNGKIFERSKPQYESYPSSSFVSVKTAGAVGDGVADDTAAIQKAMDNIQAGQILYFDHGAYVITSTVKVPKNIMITGEMWPLIMASGSFFTDQANPKAVFQIGQPGDSGAVEISDLIFETKGPVQGAILMEWNLASAQGASGAWDTHFRIGGSAGTQLQSDTCAKSPSADHSTVNKNCEA
ncbi:hypothetical protein LTR66_014403, partial [Elasticomyces elasticus]